MIHQYKLGGYNIVLDVCSGGVHVVDDVAYDIISLFETTSREDILSAFPDALCCEMEGAAICQVCYANGVEVGILRAISDNCNDPSTMDYATFRDSSAKVGCKILLDFMSRI